MKKILLATIIGAATILSGCSKVANIFSSEPSTCEKIYQRIFPGAILTIEKGTDKSGVCSAVVTADNGNFYKIAYKIEALYETYEGGRFTYDVLSQKIIQQISNDSFPTDVSGLKKIAAKFQEAGRTSVECLAIWDAVSDGKTSLHANINAIRGCNTPVLMVNAWEQLDRALPRDIADYEPPSTACPQTTETSAAEATKNGNFFMWLPSELGECKYIQAINHGSSFDASIVHYKYEPVRGGGYRKAGNYIEDRPVRITSSDYDPSESEDFKSLPQALKDYCYKKVAAYKEERRAAEEELQKYLALPPSPGIGY